MVTTNKTVNTRIFKGLIVLAPFKGLTTTEQIRHAFVAAPPVAIRTAFACAPNRAKQRNAEHEHQVCLLLHIHSLHIVKLTKSKQNMPKVKPSRIKVKSRLASICSIVGP